jgi:hypothetical protein
MVEVVARDVIGQWLTSHFPWEEKSASFDMMKCCATRNPNTSRTTSPTFGNRQVEIESQLVSIQAAVKEIED